MRQTILLTRQESQSFELQKFLQNENFEVILEPIFDVEKQSAKIKNDEIDFVIITSANACDCLLSSGLPKKIKIYAVGQQSAKKLILEGYQNVILPQKANAKSLLDLILSNESVKKALYFCGEEVTVDFKNKLEKQGFEVEKIIAYKVNWHQDFSNKFLEKIKTIKVDFVLFYSNNNAKNFYKLAKNNNLLEYFNSSKLLSISDEITATLKNLGFRNCSNFDEIPALKKFYNND